MSRKPPSRAKQTRGEDHLVRERVSDALAAVGLWLLIACIRALPTDVSSAIGAKLGALIGPFLYPKTDERARRTMHVLRPDLSDGARLERAVERMWGCLGRAYAELPSEHRLWDEGRVAVENEGVLAAVTAAGRPLIVAGLHTGNWELLPITIGNMGRKVVQAYQPQPGRVAEGAVTGIRLRAARIIATRQRRQLPDAFKLVPPSSRAGFELVSSIRSGWTAVMFVDDDPDGRCVSPSFDGTVPGHGNLMRVVRLAQITGAAIVPAYVERGRGARFVVHFQPPLSGGTREELAASLNRSLAEPARRLADQWFMLPTYRLRG